jgi:chromosome segregation ATPase
MIFRYPVILALTIAMAAVHDAQGQLVRGSIDNTPNDHPNDQPLSATNSDDKSIAEVQLFLHEAELHEVDQEVSTLEVSVQQKASEIEHKAKVIENLRKARQHHKSEIERMQMMLREIEGSQHPNVTRMNRMLAELQASPQQSNDVIRLRAAAIKTAIIGAQ